MTKQPEILEVAGERYYTVSAAAAYLGRDAQWIYAAMARHALASYRLPLYPRRRFIAERDLIALRDAPAILIERSA